MPTGGVTRENAGDWIRAGAVAIGVGTALVDRAAVARRPPATTSPPRRVSSSRPSPCARGHDRPEGGGAMKAVCFGEIMLRLSPPGVERFFQSPALQATFGGGEANVAVSLAHFGCDSHYVTRLPANPIGDAAAARPARRGRRTSRTCCAAGRASASTSPKPAQASAPRRSSTTVRIPR